MTDDLGAGADPDLPDDLLAPSPQAEFEETLRMASGRAPFGECMDMAAAIIVEDICLRDGPSARLEVGLAVVTVLALALYQSGVNHYAEHHDRLPLMGYHDVPVSRVSALLADPARTAGLRDLVPGHRAWPDGRLRTYWTEYVAQELDQQRRDEWALLCRQARAALATVSTTFAGTQGGRLQDLLTVLARWRTQGWYSSADFPTLPAGEGP